MSNIIYMNMYNIIVYVEMSNERMRRRRGMEDGHGGLVWLGPVEAHWRQRSIEVS